MNNQYFTYTPGLEPIANAARTATTNEELAVISERLNIADKIFLGKVDLWLAKHALSTVYRTLKKYPALRRIMNYFGTLNGFMKYKDELINNQYAIDEAEIKYLTDESEKLALKCKELFKNGNGLAAAFFLTCNNYTICGIIINGKSFNHQDLLKVLETNELLGFSPKNCKSVKSVIEHELGHMLDQFLGINTSYEFKKLLKKFTITEIGKNLSEYTILNNQIDELEMVAEGYSEYCNNPNPREIASTIGQLIEKKYQTKYGKINK